MRSRVLVVVAGCLTVAVMAASMSATPMSETRILPETITVGPGVIPDAIGDKGSLSYLSYRAALESPEILASVPCTCGCMDVLGLEHENNLDCYIDRIHPDGSVTFTTHGVGCGICQLITLDALEGADAGMSAAELTDMVMERYGPRQH